MKFRTRREWAADWRAAMSAALDHALSTVPGDVAQSFADGFGWIGEALDLQVRQAVARLKNPQGADLDEDIKGYPIPSRKAADKALVNVWFALDAGATLPVTVLAGTSVRAGTDGPLYLTQVPAALSASGLITCEAAAEGSASRVKAGEIDAMPSPVAGIAAVYNPADSTGGDDAETDTQLLARKAKWWDSLAKGTLAALEGAALSVPGVVFSGCKENWPAIGEVTVTVCDGQGSTSAALIAAAQAAVESGGPASSPGYRAHGIPVHCAAPRRLLLKMTLRALMASGKAADAETEIKAAAKAAVEALGIGAKLSLTGIGSAVVNAVETVAGVTGIAAESIELPYYLPVRVTDAGGAPVAAGVWEWDYANTRLRWAGGAWQSVLAGGAMTFYGADGGSWIKAEIEPFTSGGSWPPYQMEETAARTALSELTQLDKHQVFLSGPITVEPAAIGVILSGA